MTKRQKDKKTKRQKDKTTKRQKGKKTKRQKDNKTKRQKDKKKQKDKKTKDKDQKESLLLRRQGSFALLRCFGNVYDSSGCGFASQSAASSSSCTKRMSAFTRS